MDKSKYTPGPWSVGKDRNVPCGGPVMKKWTFDAYSQQIADEKDERVAFVDPMHKMSPEELKETGALMAAAPELLAGLIDMFALMDEGILVRSIENDADPNWHIRAMKVVNRLKDAFDAVQKAQGR